MAVIPKEYENLLYTTALAHIATIGPKGEPQSTPVWFDYDGTNIRFSQTKNRQKYRNLLRDPRIALSIVDPTNPYRYLEIRGKVARIDEDSDLHFINFMAKNTWGKIPFPGISQAMNELLSLFNLSTQLTWVKPEDPRFFILW